MTLVLQIKELWNPQTESFFYVYFNVALKHDKWRTQDSEHFDMNTWWYERHM